MKRCLSLLVAMTLLGARLALAQCAGASGVLQAVPSSLDFGNVTVNTGKSLTLTLRNQDPSNPLSIIGINSLNGRFTVKSPALPFCIDAGGQKDLEVTFTPKQEGVVVSQIKIQSTGGTIAVATSGTGVGGGGGGLKVSVNSLNFGQVKVGQSSVKTFSILNQGSSQAAVDRVSSSNSAFKVSAPAFPKTIAAGKSLDVSVTFAPTKSGSVSATLSVISGGSTAASLTATGEGSSGTPKITLNPSQIDFGTADIGTFVERPFSVSNSGNADLQVAFSADPLIKVTPAGPVTVGPGKSAQFSIRLIADALGAIAKSYNVLSNDPATPKAALSLKVTGVQGAFGFVNRTVRSRINGNPNETSALQYIDFDQDGKTDLYLTGFDGNLMCRNNGGAQFSNSTNTAKLGNNGHDSRGVTWADVDNDGDLDVFIANYDAPSVILKNTNNVFNAPPGVAPSPGLFPTDVPTNSTGGIFVDFNNDSRIDIFVVKDGQPNQLFKNLGGFSFANIASSAGVAFSGPGRGAVAADFNGDGYQDLYVAYAGRPNKLYVNNKNETFRDGTTAAGVGFSGATQEVQAVDFDGDGDLDIFVVNGNGPSVLYRNLGNLKFQNIAGAAGLTLPKKGKSATWSDFDKDGDLDVIIAQAPGDNMLFRNNGNAKFSRVTNVDLSNANNPTAVVTGDSDNDGDSDVAIGDSDSGSNSGDSIYQNTGGGANNYLVLTLQGTRSNRTAIGAKVILKTGALFQAQVVSGGDGKNQSSLPLEFGLGAATSATLLIGWPSGTVQTLENVAANQKLKIVEPTN